VVAVGRGTTSISTVPAISCMASIAGAASMDVWLHLKSTHVSEQHTPHEQKVLAPAV